jgi:glyoxylase-like metal-dependent hydrolase (beta-lactamase superfamily II)
MREPGRYGLLAAVFLTLFCAVPLEAAEKPLEILVYTSPEEHMGLGVNSTLVMGEREAVLVDAQFTLSNAHRLTAEILESGRELTHIYITHLHPDHFMGLPVLKEAFPAARVVSLPGIAKDVNEAADFKIEYWGKQVLGRNGAKSKVIVEPLQQPVLMLEGRRLEIVGPYQGDAANSSGVWIPSIRTLIASDLLFNEAHVWMADGKTPALRNAWLEALDELEALDPLVVVPGHAPSADYLSPDAIAFTRDYIEAFLDALGESDNSDDLVATMLEKYPNAGLRFALEYSARILRDDWQWEGEWPPSLRATKVVR